MDQPWQALHSINSLKLRLKVLKNISCHFWISQFLWYYRVRNSRVISFGCIGSERGAQNVTESWEEPHTVTIIISELKDVIDGLLEYIWGVFHVKNIWDIFCRYQDSSENMEFMATRLFKMGLFWEIQGKWWSIERLSIPILPFNW